MYYLIKTFIIIKYMLIYSVNDSIKQGSEISQ